jgi:hypothetical protein
LIVVYKLAFFVPDSHVEVVKGAVFAAGGGRIGDYDHCAWQVLGSGQFRPLDGSQPFIGEAGQVERVEEWKVELVVADELIVAVVAALKLSHPYETPAYEVWRLEDF